MTQRYQLVSTPGLPLHAFCDQTGLHPDLVRRYLALGLLSASPDAIGEPRFDRRQVLVAGQIQRLRHGLGLNYASIGLLLDLLDRIHRLEARLESRTPWI